MKCHRQLLTILVVSLAINSCIGDAVSESLVAEHRSAKPEPFLKRLQEALFGSTAKKSDKPPQGGPPPKRGPVYKRPPIQQALPSLQTPVVATRPQNRPRPINDGYGAPQAPPISRPQGPAVRPPRPPVVQPGGSSQYQPAASNNFPNVFGGSGSGFGSGNGINSVEPWQTSQPANMAQIRDLQVQCEKDLMRVRVEFDRPFYGMIFSKGHYSNVQCVHVPSGLGQTQATFDIALRSCGMVSSVNDGYNSPTPQGSFIENTIIIQYDPLLQEVWDQARKLRCTWYDFYEKAVTFKPYQVDMLDPVTANFLGDNLRCWMQIQVGKGPHASEVSGIVKIGQTMTMVLGVKDDENKFDMMVRNCVAHDGQRSPIQLVDEKGCVVRSKIMSPFKKIKNFDATANVLSYAYFQAFKFPDSMNVHFQCVVQVCRGSCPEPQCGGGSGYIDSGPISGSGSGSGFGQTSPSGVYSVQPQSPAPDSYGSPLGNTIVSNPNINPRLPLGGQTVYTPSGSERRVTIVNTDGSEVVDLQDGDSIEEKLGVSDEVEVERIELSEPGYENVLNKRMGPLDLGGRPRSLDIEEDSDKIRAQPLKSEAKTVNKVGAGVGQDHKVVRTRRSEESASFKVLRISKREAEEKPVAELEKVIQVLSPNELQDVPSNNGEEEEDEEAHATEDGPVSGLLSESVCLDTSAFIGVTIAFLMILIVALITIVFLWMRIRSLDKRQML